MFISTWLLRRLTVITISVLCLFINVEIRAQSDELFITGFSPNLELSAAENKTARLGAVNHLEQLLVKDQFSLAQVVYTQSLADLISTNQGRFNISLPGRSGYTVSNSVIVSAWDYIDSNNYTFSGFVPDDPTSIVGLQSEKGILSGLIRIDNVSYTLSGEAPGIGLLLQRKATGPIEVCGAPNLEKIKVAVPKASEALDIGKNQACNNQDIRILVMYTNAALNSGRNVWNEAGTSVNLLNTMLSNTGLTVRAQLTGVVAFPEYVESTIAEQDLRRLGGLEETTSSVPPVPALVQTINNARTAADADLVVVLVGVSGNRRWGGILGIADVNTRDNIFGPPNFLALVDVATSNADFVFQHEVGHLLGCRHELIQFPQCNQGKWLSDHTELLLDGSEAMQLGHFEDPTAGADHASIDASCSGFLQKYQGDVSVMFSRPDFDAGIVRRKARWDVDYLPRFSTVVGSADNRAQIRDVAQQVANLQPCRPRFRATVTGIPPSGAPGQRIYPVATTQDCSGTVVYEWRTSTNGTSYTTVSSSRTPTITIPSNLPNNSSFFIRLVARCNADNDGNPLNDETVTVNQSVIVNSGCGSGTPCLRASDYAENLAAVLHDDKPLDISLSPNPAYSDLIIELTEPIALQDLETSVFDVNGVQQSIYHFSGDNSRIPIKGSPQRTASTKVNVLTIDVSELPNGFYFLQVKTPEEQYTKPFVKN